MKVIKFLENKGTFLKGSTAKVTSQKAGFFTFLNSERAGGQFNTPMVFWKMYPLKRGWKPGFL